MAIPAAAAIVPLFFLFFGGRRRVRAPARPLYGPDALQQFAQDSIAIPPEEIREYQTPIAPPPAQQAYQAPPAAPSWDPATQAPPWAPPDASFFSPLPGNEFYGAPPVPGDVPQPPAPQPAPPPAGTPYPTDAPPTHSWEPVGNQATRQAAARALAQHLLTTRGAQRDRALIRQLQSALGIRVDGLVGNETLGAIARYGNLTPQELAALQTTEHH